MKDRSQLTPAALMEQISQLSGLNAEQSEEAMIALLDSVTCALRERRTVSLPGLGVLTVQDRGGTTRVKFQLSSTFREELHAPQATPPLRRGATTLRPDKVEP